MADDKIRISWDEVYSRDVDDKIKQGEAIARTREHVQRQEVPVAAHARPSLLYNTLIYMTLFGAIGGIVAWAVGELAYKAIRIEHEEYLLFQKRVNDIDVQIQMGRLDPAVAEELFLQLGSEYRNNRYVAVLLDPTLDPPTRQARIREMEVADQTRYFFRDCIWFSLLGTILALSLAVAEPIVSRNPQGVAVNGAVGAVLGLCGGVLVSLFINSLYRALGGGNQSSFGQQVLARAIGWAILGLFLAIGPGLVLRNGKKLAIGLAGGFLGGLMGGALFDPLGTVFGNALASRCVAVIAIGCFTGLGTGVIENALKTGWLYVTAGLIAGKQFILYRNPTTIGSSPEVEVYLFKDPQISPRHARIHVMAGWFELEDLGSASGTFVNDLPVARVRLRSGDVIRIGSTFFTFQERAKAPA